MEERESASQSNEHVGTPPPPRALREDEILFRALFDRAPIGIALVDHNGRCVRANRALSRMFGYSVEELQDASFGTVSFPEDADLGWKLASEMFARRRDAFQYEQRFIRKDGSILWGRLSAAYVEPMESDEAFLLAMLEDITQAKRTALALEESLQFITAVIQGAGEGIAVYDRNDVILAWNPFMEYLTGVSAAEALGRQALDIFPHLKKDENRRAHAEALAGKMVRLDERPYMIAQTGRSGYVSISIGPHRNPAGEIVGIIKVIHDTTESHNAREQLQVALADLERAYKLQQEFLNNVTHEVRTPLTAVQGYARMLIEGVAGPVSEQQSELLRRIVSSSDQLIAMVTEILEVSKMGSGNPTLNPRACRPDVVVATAVAGVTPQAAKKGLTVSVHGGVCAVRLYDELKLTMVLTNLLGNAVKFTDSGGVDVYVEDKPDGVEIVVADTGRGIDPEDLPLIFEEFRQLDHPTRHKPDGFGLGLAVVAAMVDAMNGTISVSSQQKLGTAFTVYIPAAEV